MTRTPETSKVLWLPLGLKGHRKKWVYEGRDHGATPATRSWSLGGTWPLPANTAWSKKREEQLVPSSSWFFAGASHWPTGKSPWRSECAIHGTSLDEKGAKQGREWMWGTRQVGRAAQLGDNDIIAWSWDGSPPWLCEWCCWLSSCITCLGDASST